MASSDNVAKESATGLCCVTGGESDGGGEDVYQSCGSDVDDDVDETTQLTAKVKLPGWKTRMPLYLYSYAHKSSFCCKLAART